MKLIRFNQAQLFLEKIEDFLVKEEAVNNLLLGLLYGLVQSEKKGSAVTDTYMCSIQDSDDNLVMTILMNQRNLILYGEGREIDKAIDTAINDISNAGLEIPGIVGPKEMAHQFAQKWALRKNYHPVLIMNQRIYRLDQVHPIRYSSGQLRLANSRDMDLVAAWIYEFCESIDEKMTWEEASEKANNNIHEQSLFLWCDPQPVSMAKKTRPTKNGIVIGVVYTPPQFRNHGYASSCVASLSQQLLNDGYTYCSLYTDLANPTSNHIYTQVGYIPIQDSVMYRFRGQ